MSKRPCTVVTCKEFVEPGHKFPTGDIQKIKEWIALSGNKELLNVSPSTIKYRVICHKHFDKKYLLNKKLTKTAVPTLFLPGKMQSYQVTRYCGSLYLMFQIKLIVAAITLHLVGSIYHLEDQQM